MHYYICVCITISACALLYLRVHYYICVCITISACALYLRVHYYICVCIISACALLYLRVHYYICVCIIISANKSEHILVRIQACTGYFRSSKNTVDITSNKPKVPFILNVSQLVFCSRLTRNVQRINPQKNSYKIFW